MMSNLRAAAAACALAAALTAAPAQAAIDLQSYEFGGIVDLGFLFGETFVGGAFTLGVDTETDDVTLQSIDVGYGDFTTANSSAYRDGDHIVVRGLAGTFNVSVRSFQFRFDPDPLAFVGLSAGYDICSEVFCVGDSGDADEGFIRRTDVPEPATWALLILGFAGAGAALRRHRAPSPARAGPVA